MKTAQELRAGNVVMIGNDPMVILKTEYNKSGRNAAVVKIKMKNLLKFQLLLLSSKIGQLALDPHSQTCDPSSPYIFI